MPPHLQMSEITGRDGDHLGGNGYAPVRALAQVHVL